jgi:tetratricopeptide (TPR) repeat protein
MPKTLFVAICTVPWLAGAVLLPPEVVAREPPQAPVVSRDWKRVRSPHFVAMGTVNERALRRGLTHLELFRSALANVLPRIELASGSTHYLVVLRTERQYFDFAPPDARGQPDIRTSGYFVPGDNVNHMVVDEVAGFGVLFHEYTHWVVHQTLGNSIPTWADEGLAEFYSMLTIDEPNDRILIGMLHPRYGALRDGVLLPLRKVINREGAAQYLKDENDVQKFYAQSWALIHYLSIGHNGSREGQLSRYLLSVAAGKSSEEAFEEAFKVTPEALHEELRAYLSRPTIAAKILPLPALAPSDLSDAEPMYEWEALRLRGDVLRRVRRLPDAEKALLAAQKAAPDHPDVLEALGALRTAQDRPDEAVTLLRPVAAARPQGYDAQYYLASALADSNQHASALPHYERAVAINRTARSAWLGLSLTLAVLNRQAESDEAMAQLRAIDSDPVWVRARAYGAWRHGLDALVLQEALAFIRLVGFSSERGTYAAFLGSLAGRRIGAAAQVKLLLDGATAAQSPGTWPASVAAFLQGAIDAKTFLGRARDNGQRTEAHAYIGLIATIDGRHAEAMTHLQWVLDRGSKNYVEYGLVKQEMARVRSRQ